MPDTPLVAIVGGGIAGLLSAYEIERRTSDVEVILLEAGSRVGGKVLTDELEGIVIEAGPDSFLARDEAPIHLCRELGVGDRLVEPRSFGAWLWRKGRLRQLPEGFVLGLPASPSAILRARILSPAGALRAAGDLVLPGPLAGPDVSIGDFVRHRFGREVLDRLVDPLLAGTRAGRVEEISLSAAAPQIDEIARKYRSVTRGLRSARRRGGLEPRPRFYALRGGMETLPRTVSDRLTRTRVVTGAPVDSVTETSTAYALSFDNQIVEADAVVIAVPPPAAAGIVRELSPAATGLLERIEFASVAVATFVYPPGAVKIPPHGSGFLVPASENKVLAACTWFSAKWPHLAPSDGRQVLRAFAGRASDDPTLDGSDAALLDRMRAELGDAMNITVDPEAKRLHRWDAAVPQMKVGHLDLIAAIEGHLRPHRIALAGAGYRGTGIADCLAQARAAAAMALAAKP